MADGGGFGDPTDDNGSSIVVTTSRTSEITQVQLVTGVVLTVLSGLLIVYTLMEIHRTHNRFDHFDDELELDCNDDQAPAAPESNSSSSSSSSSLPRLKRPLQWFQKILIVAQVGTLILLNYLLLVYLPASISLSVLAAFLVWCLTLHQVIVEECVRRQRYDRILVILTCFLVIAAALSLSTFARLTQMEGTLYRGPARIIGYNTDNYSNQKGQPAIRTDLIVSFGGESSCPENPTECQSTVSGVLCQDKFTEPSDESFDTYSNSTDDDLNHVDDGAGRTRRSLLRYLDNNNVTQDDVEMKNQELEDELEQEKEENQQLEQDLEDEEAANAELEQDLDQTKDDGVDVDTTTDDYSYYGNWSFDDGWYDDGYWTDYDWSSVWGEYACGDLFTSDLEQMDPYDYNKLPGNDSWPYVTIYGSCNSCNAYLVDYYSTEHFASINDFLTHSRYYGAAAALVGLLTILAAAKQRWSPSHEKEIELLSHSVHRTNTSAIMSGERTSNPTVNVALFS